MAALAVAAGALFLSASACGTPGSPGSRTKGTERKVPARIVSLAPNITEILFALGAGDRVVGVTEYCNYPPEVTRLPKVGGFVNPNPEVIIALHPDLIIATPNVGNQPFVERVMAAGARVEVVQARNVEEIFPAIGAIARACGLEEAGTALGLKIHADLDRLHRGVATRARPRVLFCLQIDPLVAAGPGSYPGDLVALAGGVNIVPASAGNYPSLSLEEVIRSGPSVIVQSLMDGGGGDSGSSAIRSYWEKYSSIPAVRNGRLVTISGDLVLRPGPRVAEGVAALIELLNGPGSSRTTPAGGSPSESRSPGAIPAGNSPSGSSPSGSSPSGTSQSETGSAAGTRSGTVSVARFDDAPGVLRQLNGASAPPSRTAPPTPAPAQAVVRRKAR